MTAGTTDAAEPSRLEVAGVPVTTRPVELGRDDEPVSELITRTNRHDDLDWLMTVPQFQLELGPSGPYDPVRDCRVAVRGEEIVGFTRVSSRARGPQKVVHRIELWTAPEWRRHGIGTALAAWCESRTAALVGQPGLWPEGSIHELSSTIDESNLASVAFAEALGYRLIRYSFEMRRKLDTPIPSVALPAGLELRPVEERDHRKIWRANAEGFRDHWEAAERTEADFVQTYADPDLDTSLWRVAWDGDEVAGVSMNAIFAEENEELGIKVGWIEQLSTRRPWRRRGVAAAMLASTLEAFRDRGMEEASLGVDAENPTGALALYERLGFTRHRSFRVYRKAVPPAE